MSEMTAAATHWKKNEWTERRKDQRSPAKSGEMEYPETHDDLGEKDEVFGSFSVPWEKERGVLDQSTERDEREVRTRALASR